MTWLFVALWRLPASNSLTRTAGARECVYGSVGGPKRPRSKLSLSRMQLSAIGLFPAPAWPGCCQGATQGRIQNRGPHAHSRIAPPREGLESRLDQIHAPASARAAIVEI